MCNRVFAIAQISASRSFQIQILISLCVLRHRFLCLYDRGPCRSDRETPILQAHSVSGLYYVEIIVESKNNSTAMLHKTVVDLLAAPF